MTSKFDSLLLDPEFRKQYAVERLIADASQFICDQLELRKMKQADLARLLNKTPAFVSQLLSGKTNMTVRTLAEIANALETTVKISSSEESAAREKPGTSSDKRIFQTFEARLPMHPAYFEFQTHHWDHRLRDDPSTQDVPAFSEEVA